MASEIISPNKELFGSGLAPSLVELLRWRASVQPDRLAYTFLEDGETKEVSLTYAELDRKARAIAALLQSVKATGERVLLAYPPGLDYIAAFFGALYAGAAAVPCYPPRPNRSLTRIETIITDAQATIVASTSAVLSKIKTPIAATSLLDQLRWLATDTIDDDLAAAWKEPEIDEDTLAFLQYTSGSSAQPKGVMVTHGNVLYNQRMIRTAFRQSEESVIVSWLPLYHDMGLIGGLLQPLYLGAKCIVMSPVSFLQRPLRWLRAISTYKATTSGGPNSAYELCIRKVAPEHRASLDLSNWAVAFNGSEPVRAETLERFAAAFEISGFRKESFFPCYGLAEATLIVSGGLKSELPIVKTLQAGPLEKNMAVEATTDFESARTVVSVGSSLLDEKIIIVNPETLASCTAGEVGEIWVTGPNVAQGYWNNPDETEAAFRVYLAETAEGPFLRTGDLGFMQDGQLFVTGRLKDLIIIRGLNRYPQDIELVVERSHLALRPGCGAAFSVELAGLERLVVAHEVERGWKGNLDQVIGSIRQALAEQEEIQAHAILLVGAGTIPKTSSGKLQRHACRDAFLTSSLETLAEWRVPAGPESESNVNIPESLPKDALAIQEWLVSLLALKLGIEPSSLNVENPMSRYAVDSLLAIEITHEIETRLNVTIPTSNLLDSRTIRELATHIVEQLEAAHPVNVEIRGSEADAREGRFPLSFGQKALRFMHEMSPDSSVYNIVNAFRVKGDLDAMALRRAFQSLIERHCCLRASFIVEQSEPVQIIHKHAEILFDQDDASAWSAGLLSSRLEEEARKPFDLERAPLLRLNLFKLREREHILLISVHHIVADFWSLAVLLKELRVLYEAEKSGSHALLAPVKLDYIDYTQWQAQMLSGQDGERLLEYWKANLPKQLPVLELPTDRPRPPVQTYKGASRSFNLSAELSAKLKALSKAHEATLYMSLMAAFQVLLYRYTGQEEILIGSLTSGRSRAAFAGVVGYFVNPIVVRADLAAAPTFEKLLNQVRQTVLDALQHQEYPFASLVEQLQPSRDASRSPLFQVMFTMQKAPLSDDHDLASFALGEAGVTVQFGSLELQSIALDQRTAQFDLTLMMAETSRGLAGALQYNTDLFDTQRIDRMLAHFQVLLEAIASDASQPVSQLPLLTGDERHQLLIEYNHTKRDFPQDQSIHELFEQQVARTPNAIAVVVNEEKVTYKQLNARANQLAHYLRAQGAGPDVRVSICAERSVEMIVGMLGILKAGSAYLPLDPLFPAERLIFQHQDAEALVLLTQQNLAERFSNHAVRIICLDSDWQKIALESEANPASLSNANNLAYVMYTSGSTGQPKGVMVEHRNVVNFFAALDDRIGNKRPGVWLALTSISFDISVSELLWTLTRGFEVIVHAESETKSPDKSKQEKIAGGNHYSVSAQLRSHNVSHLQCTPSMIRMLSMEAEWPDALRSLSKLMLGGEALPLSLAKQLGQLTPAEIHNMYGPTETTIWSTTALIDGAADAISLGEPIANTVIYILDNHLQPVPKGVPGQLYIGGEGVSRGYLNRPALTAEKFIPNPFGKKAGARLYKTGDLVSYRLNGGLEFIGRTDHQVKIRGYRIEPAEIEAALSQHAAVSEVVVMAREDAPGDKRLTAYVVADAQSNLTGGELRDFLKQRLPDYMVPSIFMFLDSLPLMPNGKVNRQKLPAPNSSGTRLSLSHVAPTTSVEEALAVIWSELLGVEQVGSYDSFFDLGGHSLLASQLVSRLREIFQLEMPLRRFFEAPTISGLAKAMLEYSDEQSRTERIAELFVSVARSSDEELNAMLQDCSGPPPIV
jgi:amino acid adenylation domain-containing protein